MKTMLIVLAALSAPLAAHAFDISPYGRVQCIDVNTCFIVVPLVETMNKADCEKAYGAAYQILDQSGRLITETNRCDVDQGIREVNGREHYYTKGYKGSISFRLLSRPKP